MRLPPRLSGSAGIVRLVAFATLMCTSAAAWSAAAEAESASRPAAATAAPTAATMTTDSQREAAAILRRMADHLAGLDKLTFTMRGGYDVVQASGQKIEFGETRRISVERPGRLRIEEVSSDGKQNLVLFDGRTLTVFDADALVYAQAAQPASLDDAIVYFVRDLRMRMPLAQLLTSRVRSELPQRIKTIDYVEQTEIDGVPADHIAGRGETVDFQFWISQGEHPLPRRIVLTYRNSPGEPQFWADFVGWNTAPKFTKTSFQFSPPPGSRKIAFAVQVRELNDARQTPGAATESKP